MRRTLAALVVGLAACGGAAQTTTTVAATTTTAAQPTTTQPDATTTTSGAASGIHLAATGLGSILVDGEGRTLYVFTQDADGESVCYGSCEDNWPPVAGDAAVDPGLDTTAFRFGTTTRTDGSTQLTLDGMPLYRFAGDSAPGDTNGQGLNGVWFVIDANGEMVTEAGSSQASPPDDYGY